MLKKTLIFASGLTLATHAETPKKEAKKPEAPKTEQVAEKKEEAKKPLTDLQKAEKEQKRLATFNALATEKQKHATLELRTEVAALKLERELLTEKLNLTKLKRSAAEAEVIAKFEDEKAQLTREATLAKLRADQLTSELKELKAAASLKTSTLMAQISEIETNRKREAYANATPQYLDDPLQPDGSLVISDRRIPFNGPVTSALADAVTKRINYYNNKDPKKPIFIVIDDSPGGSVMAGYRILKAMEGSKAPVYVVVKSFAASMAACITTLAEKSYTYPNAIILHHQLSQTYAYTRMNLTDQKEAYEDMKRWWHRLADPISQKMGITSDEFIEMMYEKTKSGDWTEFGDEAKKLKWVDFVVDRVHETSLLKDPNSKTSASISTAGFSDLNGLTPAIDDKGNKFMMLPRMNPKDVYFMYNPDGFYRFK